MSLEKRNIDAVKTTDKDDESNLSNSAVVVKRQFVRQLPEDASVREIYSSVTPLHRELIARKWLKENGLYWAKLDGLSTQLFHHFASLLRRPAGRADKERGSQQCAFEMPIPHSMCIEHLFSGLERHVRKKYAVDSTGKVVWLDSPTID
eukprot:6182595-Pleurochrysis_carterae.AAC.1